MVYVFWVVNLLFGWSWDTNTLWLYRDWIGKQLAGDTIFFRLLSEELICKIEILKNNLVFQICDYI